MIEALHACVAWHEDLVAGSLESWMFFPNCGLVAKSLDNVILFLHVTGKTCWDTCHEVVGPFQHTHYHNRVAFQRDCVRVKLTVFIEVSGFGLVSSLVSGSARGCMYKTVANFVSSYGEEGPCHGHVPTWLRTARLGRGWCTKGSRAPKLISKWLRYSKKPVLLLVSPPQLLIYEASAIRCHLFFSLLTRRFKFLSKKSQILNGKVTGKQCYENSSGCLVVHGLLWRCSVSFEE